MSFLNKAGFDGDALMNGCDSENEDNNLQSGINGNSLNMKPYNHYEGNHQQNGIQSPAMNGLNGHSSMQQQANKLNYDHSFIRPEQQPLYNNNNNHYQNGTPLTNQISNNNTQLPYNPNPSNGQRHEYNIPSVPKKVQVNGDNCNQMNGHNYHGQQPQNIQQNRIVTQQKNYSDIHNNQQKLQESNENINKENIDQFGQNNIREMKNGIKQNGVSNEVYTPKYGHTRRGDKSHSSSIHIDPRASDLIKKLTHGQAVKSTERMHLTCNHLLSYMSGSINQFNKHLSGLTNNNIQNFYASEFKEVLDMLVRAFDKSENNSLMLLSRNKQVIHTFLNQIEKRIIQITSVSSKDRYFKVVRVNSILNNSEGKIFQKFCEALNFKQVQKNYTVEMMDEVQKFFNEQNNFCLLFILEDIDFYISNTKQIILYRILDMLQYCQIPFVFLATSQKVDIVDSFEKRIKSRFSHRQILFYEETFDQFKGAVNDIFIQHFQQPYETKRQDLEERQKNGDETNEGDGELELNLYDIGEQVKYLKEMILSDQTLQFLEASFDSGKSFDYLSQQLRTILCNVDLKLQNKIKTKNKADLVQVLMVPQFMSKCYQEALGFVKNMQYVDGEPEIVMKNLPRISLQVLITAKKVGEKASLFNFEAVYQEYRKFMFQAQKMQNAKLTDISRETFLKIFLDLVNQGYLHSESQTDILSVNNKVALAFRAKDFTEMLKRNLASTDVGPAMQAWALA